MTPFSKDSAHDQEGRQGTTPTVIAKQTRITGEVAGGHGVRVEGAIKGTVALKAPLEVAAGATVEAEVQATSIRIAGTVIGNITVTELAELLAGSVVKGDITAPALHVVEGARLEGRVNMQAERPAAPVAKPQTTPEKPR